MSLLAAHQRHRRCYSRMYCTHTHTHTHVFPSPTSLYRGGERGPTWYALTHSLAIPRWDRDRSAGRSTTTRSLAYLLASNIHTRTMSITPSPLTLPAGPGPCPPKREPSTQNLQSETASGLFFRARRGCCVLLQIVNWTAIVSQLARSA